MRTRFSMLFLLVVSLPLLAHGIGDQKYIKEKSIKKTYLVNADAGVDIQNSYGTVYVTTWKENKIELDILIKVGSNNESWAIKKLDDITVDIDALKNLVSAKTQFRNGAGNSSGNNSIEVNYTVKIPSNGSAQLSNKYGNIITTDLSGQANVRCDYGKITLGKLQASSNTIKIAYCSKSSIEYVRSASLSADYSGITVNDFGNLVLKADYTDVSLKSGNNLKYNCSYGKVYCDKINNLEGDGDYLTLSFDEIGGNLKINTEYSQLSIGRLTSKTGNVYINSAYTNVGIGIESGYAFDFDVRVKYANFKYPADVEMQSRQENGNNKSYQGYFKKPGGNSLTVISEFGNVQLTKK